MVEFTKETPVLVRNFHYDLNEENHVKSEVNIALRKAAQKDDEGNLLEAEGGSYFEIAVPSEVSPNPGEFTVSGLITQVVFLKDYYGDGQDLEKSDYKLLSRPLVEYIETLTYQLTSVALDEPVNLNFTPNF